MLFRIFLKLFFKCFQHFLNATQNFLPQSFVKFLSTFHPKNINTSEKSEIRGRLNKNWEQFQKKFYIFETIQYLQARLRGIH